MSKKKKDHAREESGFEDWGGYMAAKKTKLEEQFHNAVSKNFKESSKLFEGIAIFVNGYTDPTADELKRLMMMHGGVYHYYMRPKITTHIIATNLPYSKIMSYRKSQNPIPICKPQWVTDSITAGKILNFQNYLLYSNDINLQPQLTHKLSIKNGKFHIDPTTYDKQDTERLTASTNIFNDKNINSNVFNQDTTNNTLKHGKVNIAQCFNTRTNAQSTRNTEFLSAFYSNSRLHYIATMGMTFKDYVNRLRDKSDGIFLGLERLTKLIKVQNVSALAGYESDSKDDTIYFNSKLGQKQEPVIMHIDMDCFFVSVGIRKMPELQNLPVAVAHAKINTHFVNYDDKGEFGSLSEIASCSYEARKAGVKNGMFLGEALKICPNLKTIQYDFEGYKEVSYMLYDTVASYTLDIEAVSCDEMYANCTKILQTSSLSPMEFATVLRKEIKQKTGCPVSTGFGNNKLQARLATRKAKPDNQFYLSNVNAETYMRTFNVRDLPGVGGTTAHKLHEMNARTCEELQRISLATLQNEFGKKMGEQLYKMCRGLDDKKLNIEHVRKSVSAEVNYGIRFRNNEDAIDFLNKLATEVCSRLTIAHAKGRCITLKLMIRAEEAPKETAKFMGHGLCNYITRSKNLMTAVNDVNVIRREVINIWNQLHLTPEDMRGIGIQISRLEICRIKPNKGSLKNFFNKSKNEQTYEEAFVNNNSKDQCDSNFNISKVNSSEVPSISESSSLAMKNIFDTKIDNPLSISAQFSESITVVRNNEDTTIPFITQTKPVIFANETKNEILYHDKANENISCLIKTKDLSGKLKRIMQKQTSQENFYRHTKPSCGKSWKYEMPRIQDIDMSVLVELPQDIRNEILDEYKRNKEQPRIDTIDPDVLSALMEGNPHPDVQHDLQAHCGVRREANDKDIRVTSKKSDSSSQLGEQPRKSGQSSKICDNGEDVKTFVHNTSVQKTMRVLQENKTIQQRVKDNTDDILTMAHEKNQIEILYNNAAMDKADTFILQNLNILHNNENVDKHQEMLINLVNHLFTLPLQQAKLQIQTWVTKSNVVNEVDFLSLATFLSMLPRKKRIEDLHVLLKTMHRCTTKTGNCIWHRTYRRTVKHVQRYMQIEYNSNLMVPSIRCNDSRCNNGD